MKPPKLTEKNSKMASPLRGLVLAWTLGAAGALYGGAWRTQRCSPEVAARLAGADLAVREPAVYIAVDRVPGDGERLMVPVANEAPITRGVPDAVGRLLPGRPLIDLLLLSCPPETAEGIEATGYCIDGLLLAWIDELNRGADARFEDLRVRGDDQIARALERRGFVPLEEEDDDADAEEPSTRKKPRPATPDDEDERPPLEVTFKIGETDRYDHAKDCSCSHCAQVRARPRTPPPAARSLPGSPVKPLAAREEPWQPCARCRPRQTKQETAKKKKGRKARRRREEAPPPPPPQPKRESPQDDAKKQSAARGRAFRSERRALARHGVGDAADPLNGGVYAETRRLRLRFARSPIHSWGVFTDEPIVQGTQVLEYRGEEIGLQVGERRQEMYERNGEIDYLFRVDDQLIVDATRMGSLARFVNHSCAPNCVSKIVPHAGRKKIVLYTKRDVAAGEELSYDYKFELEDEKIPCHCGAATCRGSLN